MMKDAIPVYTIALPEYTIEQQPDWLASAREPDRLKYAIERQPDWLAIGRKLDRLIETHFPGRRVAIRAIGLVDHPGWSLDDLVATIVAIGTDRYDPSRGGVHDDWGPDYLHAGPCVVTSEGLQGEKHIDGSVMAKVVGLFDVGTLADRGYSIRIDLLLIYDLDQLVPPPYLPEEAPTDPLRSYSFTFKDPNQKQKALLGVIKLLR